MFNDTLKVNGTSPTFNNSSLWKNRRGHGNPRNKQNRPQLDSLEIELDESDGDEKYLVSVVYSSLGELPAFLFGWIEILINVTAVSACRYHYIIAKRMNGIVKFSWMIFHFQIFLPIIF